MMKALIVDDSKVTRGLLQLYLNKLGVSDIEQVADGVEAFGKIKRKKFDIVFLDIGLPLVSGLEILRKIRSELAEESKDTHIIMCTGANDEASVREAIGHGVSGYLLKPFSMERLAEVLRIAATRKQNG
ncbi:MAG: response regulator [Negativicutes bacterium]|nr:response regulator [Negativicutes bacterium]